FINGCTRECQLEGEAFIVTKGRQNVRLGLVEVRAIPEKEILEFVEKKKATAKEELPKIKSEYENCKKNLDAAWSVQRAIQKKCLEGHSLEECESAIKQHPKAKAASSKRWTEYSNALEKYAYYYRGDFLFDNIPEGIAKVKTDADGKFAIMLKQDSKYALIARADRKIYNNTEKYYWFVWVNTEKYKTKKIFLSNDNLLATFISCGI
ncbi:MAG: hypothetical protein NTX75_02655, partial [Proteobacteria bacterium]|nr:hypothetical protein [Pseudomonadota bacterium]